MNKIIIPMMIWYFKVKVPAKIKHDYDLKLSKLTSKLDQDSKIWEI